MVLIVKYWNFNGFHMCLRQEKTDELLRPVLSAAESRSTQRTMDSFLSFNQRFAKIQSKRLARAVRGIAGGSLPEVCLVLQLCFWKVPQTFQGMAPHKRSDALTQGFGYAGF